MIRFINANDFEFYFMMYMHPTINPFLLYEPMSKDAFLPIFNDLLKKKICFIYQEDNLPMGIFKLVPETDRSKHVVYLGGVAVNPNYMGKGIGTKMFNQIIQYAKTNKYLRIVLSVAINNIPAINLYQKMGFVKEGIYKNYTYLSTENKYIDEMVMAYLFPLP